MLKKKGKSCNEGKWVVNLILEGEDGGKVRGEKRSRAQPTILGGTEGEERGERDLVFFRVVNKEEVTQR